MSRITIRFLTLVEFLCIKQEKTKVFFEKVNEISGLLSKAKFDDNSFFDQLPESDFPVLTGLSKILLGMDFSIFILL
jgi:hypothetical protein